MPSEMTRNSAADLGDVWPPGFRFHPTDEELVLYYLKRKICRRKLKLDIICEVDVYKWDPEELPGLSLLKTGDRQWFFFSPRDRKYPNGSRSNRATQHGYWKTTGKDRTISCNSRTVGLKKTLVFYRGRAPSGERTDWVVHEYTLEESELKRCQDVQDCYALYKLFKKSGAGPRNGEDYGAPFREEDWADERLPEVSNYVDPANHGKLSNGTAFADIHRNDPQVQCTWDDIEEFMKQFVDDPAPEGPDIGDCEYAIPQVLVEEGQSTLTDPPSGEQNIQGCLSFTLSDTSLVQLQNVYGAASSGVNNMEQHVVAEDFLEMDDLLGPVITHDVGEYMPQPAGELNVSSQWAEVAELSELDLDNDLGTFDPGMFLRDPSPINQATASHPYADSQASQLVNTNDLERRQPSDAMNYMGPQQGAYDQNYLFSTSGDVCAGSFTPNAPQSISNEIRNGKGVEGDDTWYTSALWSFVESIPTTPASAADSALVSFSRLRLNPKSTTAAAIAEAASSGSTGGRMKGFFLLSITGVLFAILFVLMDSFGKIMFPSECIKSFKKFNGLFLIGKLN